MPSKPIRIHQTPPPRNKQQQQDHDNNFSKSFDTGGMFRPRYVNYNNKA